MKKFKYIILVFMLLFPINVFALSATPVLTCDSNSVSLGGETICHFKINVTQGKIAAVSAEYSYDSNIASIIVNKSNVWEGNADSNSVDYYGINDYSGLVNVSDIVYKLKDGAKTAGMLTFTLKELADENSTSFTYNEPVSVSFTINKNVVTTKPTTTKITTTTVKADQKITTKSAEKITTKSATNKTVTKTTTTKTDTNETTNIITTEIQDTTKKIVKHTTNKLNNNKLNVCIISVSLLLLLIIIIIIITIAKKKRDVEKYTDNNDKQAF